MDDNGIERVERKEVLTGVIANKVSVAVLSTTPAELNISNPFGGIVAVATVDPVNADEI